MDRKRERWFIWCCVSVLYFSYLLVSRVRIVHTYSDHWWWLRRQTQTRVSCVYFWKITVNFICKVNYKGLLFTLLSCTWKICYFNFFQLLFFFKFVAKNVQWNTINGSKTFRIQNAETLISLDQKIQLLAWQLFLKFR